MGLEGKKSKNWKKRNKEKINMNIMNIGENCSFKPIS